MEEQLIQTEKLRALGEMASGVAHDFNNALAVILGNTQLLLLNAKEEELRESLKVIEKVTRDSAQTVRRLQDFTRKRVHRDLAQVDLASVVKDAIEITKPRWKDETQAKGCRIEMIPNLEQRPIVVANPAELREVITNLVFNAIEAMPRGGKIEILTCERRGKGCILVSDTGIGMSEKVKNRIFEPFFTTKPFSNTGLGLSMAYGIVKRLGGEIEVESKEGQGTTFKLSFPAGEKEPREATSSAEITKGRKANILVIDDEESVRTVLSRMLAQGDHQVTVAESGEEGLRLFQEKTFDIVLTDLGMPNMSGWEVCKGIKRISPRCPVGMITGWGMEVEQGKMEESGLDFVIPKPFDFNRILVLVAGAIPSREKQGLN
jgi:CheY-like chemotaxis protein